MACGAPSGPPDGKRTTATPTIAIPGRFGAAAGGYLTAMWGSSWGLALAVGAFVFGLIAFAFVIGTPIFAVPIALVLGAALVGVQLSRRRREARELRGFREEAQADGVEFTPRDKETLISD